MAVILPRRLPARTLGVALVVAFAAACGGRANESSPPQTPHQRVVRDVTALRAAADAGASDEVVSALNRLLNAAQTQPGDREGWKGAALIRARLPPLVRQFLTEYPRTRQRLNRVRTRTPTGAEIKRWLLQTFATQRRQLVELRAELKGAAYPWGVVLQWIGETNTITALSDEELKSILSELPVAERRAVNRELRTPPR